MSVQQAMTDVREFHDKHELKSQRLEHTTPVLVAIGRNLTRNASNIGPTTQADSVPAFRVTLMMEELGELSTALGNGNELETLDALTDLLYAVLGTAVQLNLPLAKAFDEVHKSNMTKAGAVKAEDRGTGKRDKGPDYVPPNLAPLLS